MDSCLGVNRCACESGLYVNSVHIFTEPPPATDDPSAWQVLVDGVGELVDAGIVDGRAADKAALIAWAGVQGIASILVRNALPDPVEADRATEVVLDAVMGSLDNL